MSARGKDHRSQAGRCCGMVMALLVGAVLPAGLHAFTLEVKDPDNNPVSGFRWLVEADNTNQPVPGALVADSLAVDIHKSHAPVVDAGHSAGSSAAVAVANDTRYVVSVLPDSGYTMSGSNVAVGQDLVTVVVNPYPVPTAQITIFVFRDDYPINTTPNLFAANLPFEEGLEGFSVIISDAGGQMMLDAFGNPLSSTYAVDAGGEPVLDAEGAPVVDVLGNGVITTDANGEAAVKFLPPGKYGVQIIPPAGQNWIQTTTIEGTRTIDAWVQADEGPLLVEFGPSLFHIFVGFVQAFNVLDELSVPAEPTGSITGRVVYDHVSRPPVLQGFFPGPPVANAFVGLNDQSSGRGVYFGPCNEDGSFSITGVPAGIYQLVTIDKHLDTIFGFNTITVPTQDDEWDLDVGDVLSFAWFGTLEGSVFFDENENGFRDPGEVGIPGQEVLLRFRDGTVYQAVPTDLLGNYALTEVFPFFKWLVVEVDFLRFKDTGFTNVVDQGGEIPPDAGWDMPSRGQLNPQPQAEVNPNTGNNLSRTDSGGSPGDFLLQATMLFAGQTNVIDFGKVSYGPDESGGISGIVFYAVTRAEDDPRHAVGEEWEAGIPRVQVNLYQDYDSDGVIDDLDGDGEQTLADRDNYPLGWFDDPGAKGDEDVDWNDNGLFDPGDALQIVTTDSWDDDPPTGCIQDLPMIHGEQAPECFDNFGTWNQTRPGVFDGGFAIASHFPGGMANTDVEEDGIPPGVYIVEAVEPQGYQTVKEEDKNVDYGDEYIPSLAALNAVELPDLPPPCVGDLHQVPDFLSLFGDIEAPFASDDRPLCDRKQVAHSGEQNTAVEFFLFTEVPKAARAVGIINNDLAAEGNEDSPVFGEKQAPAWLPISFQDYAGNELARVYCDEFGAYNALLPSTYTVNIGAPTGVSPNMITIVLNHPGPIADPQNPGQFITDPYFDPSYTQTRYTFNFAPGTTTYVDTPVLPLAAFVGYPNRVLDSEPADGTPVINSVMGPTGGPVICANGETIAITSLGPTEVPNPDHIPGNPGSEPLITRDFGFGTEQGTVTVNGVSLAINSWDDGMIEATVDTNQVSTGQLMVTRGDNGRSTLPGITLHVGECNPVVHVTGGGEWPNTPIQDAIDGAEPGTLIVVEPGIYNENPIIWKNVKLQGSGVGSTRINGSPIPGSRVAEWNDKIDALKAAGDLIQIGDDDRFFRFIEAPVVFVLGKPGTFDAGSPGLIDGFTVMGAVAGGGVYVAGRAEQFEVSNNKITNNQGTFGGGVTVGTGTPFAPNLDSFNDAVSIHHNWIAKNGGVNGGGGVTVYRGADNYSVTDNVIIGNFTRFIGAGLLHFGLSDGATIGGNRILFNEVFYGGEAGGDGGGIFVGGSGPTPDNPTGLGAGAGSVAIISNLIQGNLAGSGSGGGIAAQRINGDDTAGNPVDWYSLNIFNNMIVNNAAAYRAGGIELQDAANVNIVHNTIAHNDSSGTAALAFTAGNLLQSNPQGAGIVAAAHRGGLASATGQTFSDPLLVNNIIYHNRSFYWDGTLNDFKGDFVPGTPEFADLAVVGEDAAMAMMDPQYCVLSDPAGYAATNISDDPSFLAEYYNTLVGAALIEEGGNFVTLRFLELNASDGDYHVEPNSPAVNAGTDGFGGVFPALDTDIDDDPRPIGGAADIGADEVENPANNPGLPGGPDGDPVDLCPDDPDKTEPGICGCGVADLDSDGDGVPDCVDQCPDSADGAAVDSAGCPLVAAGPQAQAREAALQPQEQLDSPTVWRSCGFGAGPMMVMSLLFLLGLRFMQRRRFHWMWALVAAFAIGVIPAGADVFSQCPPDTDGVDTDGNGIVDDDHVCLHMAAGDGFVNMADGRLMYMFGFHDVTGVPDAEVMATAMLAAEFAAPTITVGEGQKLFLSLTNAGMMVRPDLFDPHTIHWHGFPEASAVFDGVPSASISINMGATVTYFYNVVQPGTYMWHCHVEATEHMQMGMLGNLYVRPKQNNLPHGTDLNGFTHRSGYKYVYNDGDGSTYYDVEYPIQIHSFDPAFHDASLYVQPLPFADMKDTYHMLNGRGYPDTVNTSELLNTADELGFEPRYSQKVHSLITASKGQQLLLRISCMSTTDFYTLTVLGIPMKIVGRGARLLRGPSGKDLYYQTNCVTLGGGEAVEAILDTSQVEPGTYFLYTTNLNCLSNNTEDYGGMMTEIIINP